MYRVKLENFSGPLDLLLYFIRRDKIDIYDIPIASITKEYMDTMQMLENLNLNIAGEFILMAATLMRIKAKMLLPKPEFIDLDEESDPRVQVIFMSGAIVKLDGFSELEDGWENDKESPW